MRTNDYIKNNITLKKSRTLLCILGITFSILSTVVMGLLIDVYSDTSSGFFLPFANFDQIVEKGTSYTQLLPISSKIDESFETTIEDQLDINAIPSLLAPNSGNIISFKFHYVMGVPLNDMQDLWQYFPLEEGVWPSHPSEVIVGNGHADNETIVFNNATFIVVGHFSPTFTYIDQLIVFDLGVLQGLTNNQGIVSLFFVPKTIERTHPEKITEFEDSFPSIDVLTEQEIEEIRGNIGGFLDKLSTILMMFTTTSSLVFVFSLQILSILNRKKDFDIFLVLGAPKITTFKIIWLENMLTLFLGVIIGIPSSMVTYVFLYSYMRFRAGIDLTYWASFTRSFKMLFASFPFSTFISGIAIISIASISFAIVSSIFALRRFNLANLKQRY